LERILSLDDKAGISPSFSTCLNDSHSSVFFLTSSMKVRQESDLAHSWAISWRTSTSVGPSSFSWEFPPRVRSRTGPTLMFPLSSLRWSPVDCLGRLLPESGQDTGLSDTVLTILPGVDYSLLLLNPSVRLREEKTSAFETGAQPFQACVPSLLSVLTRSALCLPFYIFLSRDLAAF